MSGEGGRWRALARRSGIPPAVTEETAAVLGRGRRGPAARRAAAPPAAPSRSRRAASAGACRSRDDAARRDHRPGRRLQLHREPPALAARPRGAVRDRPGRVRRPPGRAGRRAAAGLRTRSDVASAWRSRSASSPVRAGSPSPASSSPDGAALMGTRALRATARGVISGVGQSADRPADRPLRLPAHARRHPRRGRRRRAHARRHRRAGHVPRRRRGQSARLRQRQPLRGAGRARHHHDLAAGPGRGDEPAVLRPGAWRSPPARPGTPSSGGRSRRAARRATPAAVRPTGRPSPCAEGPLAWLLPVGDAVAGRARSRRTRPATCTSSASPASSWPGSR